MLGIATAVVLVVVLERQVTSLVLGVVMMRMVLGWCWGARRLSAHSRKAGIFSSFWPTFAVIFSLPISAACSHLLWGGIIGENLDQERNVAYYQKEARIKTPQKDQKRFRLAPILILPWRHSAFAHHFILLFILLVPSHAEYLSTRLLRFLLLDPDLP